VTSDPSPDGPESGLPGKQGEFAIALPWIVRFAMTAAIGAAVGAAASIFILPSVGRPGTGWMMIVAGAVSGTLLSIRKVHGWHVSTFADGTIVGLAAAPIFVVLTFIHAMLQPEMHFTLRSIGHALLFALFSLVGVLITVPCGWLAGFVYHLTLTAAHRARAKDDDMAS